ncbi:carbohydrate ABC transporter membrane protein 1 (CUT1 family) [Mobilisporobacter senegalensis]|uniref:Carbohydrate ABC transporter membrane protein 1 (CUT1 family) n=1 Tax=Mobilisporobacter senegalensis TaxID=1329262 RepID=A0A3N1XQ28_9FIRM|nr:sugar ABC transporter permease [Mobilisporobacter senegalensis]ROR27202.1 carbohydrate ABC transporter membrane protein 1 (CUT1 family) [Mobilisporobacter senegalensis]
MDKMLGKKRYIAIFVLPALLLFLCFVVAPLFVTGIYSLFEYDGIGTMKFLGMDNYIELFTKDRYFPKALINSFVLAGASIFIQLPLSLLLAIVLARGVKGEKFFRTVYFVPVVISSMVIGQLWMKIFNSQYGLINIFIRFFGDKNYEFSWLSTPSTAFISTVIPAVWQYIGYHMLIFYAGIKSISTDYYEAARIDGASKTQVSLKITLPLLAPVIKTCLLFSLTGSFRAFDLIYVMTGGGPNHASEVPGTLMYNSLFRRGLYGYGSAEAFFIVIECLLFSFVIRKIFKKSEENASAI